MTISRIYDGFFWDHLRARTRVQTTSFMVAPLALSSKSTKDKADTFLALR